MLSSFYKSFKLELSILVLTLVELFSCKSFQKAITHCNVGLGLIEIFKTFAISCPKNADFIKNIGSKIFFEFFLEFL